MMQATSVQSPTASSASANSKDTASLNAMMAEEGSLGNQDKFAAAYQEAKQLAADKKAAADHRQKFDGDPVAADPESINSAQEAEVIEESDSQNQTDAEASSSEQHSEQKEHTNKEESPSEAGLLAESKAPTTGQQSLSVLEQIQASELQLKGEGSADKSPKDPLTKTEQDGTQLLTESSKVKGELANGKASGSVDTAQLLQSTTDKPLASQSSSVAELASEADNSDVEKRLQQIALKAQQGQALTVDEQKLLQQQTLVTEQDKLAKAGLSGQSLETEKLKSADLAEVAKAVRQALDSSDGDSATSKVNKEAAATLSPTATSEQVGKTASVNQSEVTQIQAAKSEKVDTEMKTGAQPSQVEAKPASQSLSNYSLNNEQQLDAQRKQEHKFASDVVVAGSESEAEAKEPKADTLSSKKEDKDILGGKAGHLEASDNKVRNDKYELASEPKVNSPSAEMDRTQPTTSSAQVGQPPASVVTSPVANQHINNSQALDAKMVAQQTAMGQQASDNQFEASQKFELAAREAPSMLKERINMMMNNGIGKAEIRLDPAELGSMHIKVSMQNDQVSVSIQTSQANSRELLDQHMPRLKEMLAEQGIQLGDSQVGQQQHSAQQSSGQEESGKGTSANGIGRDDAGQDNWESELPESGLNFVQTDKGIDFYA